MYKCNAQGHDYQRTDGDWAEVFESSGPQWWGRTRVVPELANAKVGDKILAYQTDRNELVGVAKVVRWDREGRYKRLILRPIENIGVRVRPLKEADSRLARIPAFQPGPIHTLYQISTPDALLVLKAARARLADEADEVDAEVSETKKTAGAGFGTPEENKRVERAAVRHVTRNYEARGWWVRNVGHKNLGYDLICSRSGERRHVEVKGARGEGQQFILTANELETWKRDPHFVLAFVRRALSSSPALTLYPHAKMDDFAIAPLSFVAKRRMKGTPS